MNFSPIKKNREVLINTAPAMRYDFKMDFTAWQKQAREKLVELLGIDMMIPTEPSFTIVSKTSIETYDETVYSIASEKNYSFTSTLRTPKGVSGKLPVAICLFGHADDLLQSVDGTDGRDLCKQALDRGYASLSVEQRSFDNCFAVRDITPEEAPTRTTWCACYRSSMRAFLLGRTTIGERVWDIMRSLDALLANFDNIDDENIVIVGNNGNGTAAYYAAAVDERIGAVIASNGVATYESSIATFSHCVCNYIPTVASYFDMGDFGGLIAPRKLVLVGTIKDNWFPERGLRAAYAMIEKLYAAAGASDNSKLVINDGERRFDPHAWELIK